MRNLLIISAVSAICSGALAQTNECYVAAGATKFLSEFGYSWANDDWLLKTGPGELTCVADYKNTKINLLIKEGSYLINRQCHIAAGSMIIKNGATVRFESNTTKMLGNGNWYIQLEGDGTGSGDNLGAVSVGSTISDLYLGANSTWALTGDATIYTFGSNNAIFSGASASSGPTLNMNGHTLTLKGKTGSSVFRPRWKWTINNAGPIVVRNGQFARHKTTNVISPNIPLISFTDGAVMNSYGNGTIWSSVDAFSFESGTMLKKGSQGETGVSLTMKKVTGPVEISSDATVTISNEYVVRGSDLLVGHHLVSANTLTFSSGCKLSFDDFGGVSLVPGTVYTVATSSSSISGTPVLTGDAETFFTVANTGTALTLTVKSGVIVDVVNGWGLRQGAENAAANTAAVAAHIGEIADNAILYISDGEYWFTDAFDLSQITAANIKLWNPERAATLRGGVKFGAATNVTVENVIFKECAGPAIIAEDTAGLTVRGCMFDKVGGLYVDGNKYLFAAIDVTDFNVTNNTYVLDGMLYDGQGYFERGSQCELSEAYADAVVLNIPTENLWTPWNWVTATNRLALSSSAYNGKTLRKIGGGTFDPQNTGVQTVGIASVELVKGCYWARSDSHFGVAGGAVHVCNGASLTLAGSGENIKNRVVTISGSGLGGEYPAVRISQSAVYNKTDNVHWMLEGDATMYASVTGENGIFYHSTVHMDNHTLTLNGVADSNYRVGRWLVWYEGGTVIVDKASFSVSAGDNATSYRSDDKTMPVFRFVNGAKFIPDTDEAFNLIRNVTFATGTRLTTKNSNKVNASFDDFAGNPTISDNIMSITINGIYAIAASDILSGTLPTLMNGSLAFGSNAEWVVSGSLAAFGSHRVALFSAEGGISGKLKSIADQTTDLSVYRHEKTLYIGPPLGFVLVVK